MTSTTVLTGKRAGARQSRIRLSGACRAALVWPDDPADVCSEVLDACPELLRVYLVWHKEEPYYAAPPDTRIKWVVVGDDPIAPLREAFEMDGDFFAEGRVDLHIDPRHEAAYAPLCAAITRELLDQARRVMAGVAHRTIHGWHRAANVLTNVARLGNGPTADVLAGLAAGEVVVVAGAGPSLDSDIPALRRYRDRFRLVACDSAWEPLARNGVTPDLVVTTDGSERVWRYFSRFAAEGPHVPVVAMLHSGWPVVRHYPGPILAARTAHAVDEWLAPTLPLLDAGLCVGHAAFEVARLLGGASIILSGFDLGYCRGRYHPVHMTVPYADFAPPPPENLVSIGGNDGKPMLTDQSMRLYLHEFESRIARAGVPVWNVTTAGARIRGAIRGSLEAALQGVCPMERVTLPLPQVWEAREYVTAPCRAQELLDLEQRLSRPCGDLCEGAVEGVLPGMSLADPAASAIVDMAEPFPLIEIRNQWRSWMRRGRSRAGAVDLRRRHDACFAGLRATSALFRQIARIAAPEFGCAGNVTLVVGRVPDAIGPWLDTLAQGGRKRVQFEGEPNDLEALWRQIDAIGADSLVFADGAVWPAGWGVPGCAVIDCRTTPPSTDIRPEFWLPGYAVLAVTPELGDLWRASLPPDRAVWAWNPERGKAIRCGSGESGSLPEVLSSVLDEMLVVEPPESRGIGSA